jgi:shikimate dehydrogenase
VPRLAVIGQPVAHSRSPAMQNAALGALGLGEGWSYEAIDVAAEGFEVLVRGMAAQGFAGANVTVPHKGLALAVAEAASESAQAIGAANTLVFANNRIEAHNTDAGGLIAALPGSPRGVRALVLGAGGAARAAVWALRTAGAAVDVWNRTTWRAEQIHIELTQGGATVQIEVAQDPGPAGNEPGEESAAVEIEVEESAVADPDQRAYGLIVNTTTVGLRGEDPFAHLPVAADAFFPGQVMVDMVYGEGPTALLRAAEAAGATTVDGIEILVQQGALSLGIWTGREPPLDVMRAAARA